MLALLIAAQIAAPDPGNVQRLFTVDDMPSYLIGKTGAWQVPLRVDVLPDGKIADCQAEVSGRLLKKLGVDTCKIIRRRAKFSPAQIDGRPTHGVYRTTYGFSVSDTAARPPAASHADIQLVVNRLPDGLTSPTQVKVAFVVDELGKKSACAANETGRLETTKNDPALVPIACAELLKSYEARPARVAGLPIVSVQNALVEFFAAKPGSEVK